MPPRRMKPLQHETSFGGGLDTDSSPWEVSPGRVLGSENYEIAPFGGYQDIIGYERFDGRASPSAESYFLLIIDSAVTGRHEEIDPFASVPVVDGHAGATVLTGTVANGADPDNAVGADGNLYWSADGRTWEKTGGSWQTLANDAVGLIAKYVDSGSVEKVVVAANIGSSALNGKTILLEIDDANIVAVEIDSVDQDAVPTAKEHAQARKGAANFRRATIEAVPGRGKTWVLGMLGNVLYAARDTLDGTAAYIWKSTSSGWERVPVGQSPTKTLLFREGVTTGGMAAGNVSQLTQSSQSHTATGTIRVRNDGEWNANSKAAGVITLETAVELDNGVCTITDGAGWEATVEIYGTFFDLLPGGRWETSPGNFGYGDRMYGCDGKNRGWEFDGESMLQIVTGNTNDTPEHVAWHENHLFFSFGHSLQHSGIGDPHDQTVVGGAAELTADASITVLHVEPGESGNAALSVFTRNSIAILYGTSASDWNLVDFRKEVGADPGTVQEVVQTAFFDARGVRYLESVQEFGNFRHATLSEHCQKHINQLRASPNIAAGSCIVRNKNQYRIFMSDGRALYLTFRRERLLGIMPINLERPVGSVISTEDGDGKERIFFGDATNGFVYEMERGTSFDGNAILGYMRFHPDYMGKRWHGYSKKFLRSTLQVKGEGYAELRFSFFVRDDLDRARSSSHFETIVQRIPGYWDTGLWDTGRWDESGFGPTKLKLRGTGENISFIIARQSDYFDPLEIAGIRTVYVPHRQLR